MNYRMALDLGTASSALANLYLDENGRAVRFADWHAIRIFDEPTVPDKGKPKSKKAVRREARMQRRQIERRSIRLRTIANLAPLLGLDKAHIAPDSGQHLPKLRAQAAREKVDLEDLFRIFMRLAKRRGYYGAFKGASPQTEKDAESVEEDETTEKLVSEQVASAKEVQGGSQLLEDVMRLRAAALGFESMTLGEYLNDRTERGLSIKLKVREIADNKAAKKRGKSAPNTNPENSNLYALNALVQKEFEAIWDTQSKHHPILKSTAPDGMPIKSHFHRAIFYKAPLKSPSAMVGKCSLEKNLPRAPRAQMAYQVFRVEKVLADMRWGIGRNAQPLSAQQKSVLRDLLNQQKHVAFSAAEEALARAACPKPVGKSFNLAQEGRESLVGNTTLAAFRKLGLDQDWRELQVVTQIQVINFLADLGSPEQLFEPDWQGNFAGANGQKRKFSPELITFLGVLRDHPKFDRMSKMGFDGGRASYSIKALNTLSEWLQEPHWSEGTAPGDRRIDEEAAIAQCYASANAKALGISKILSAHPPTGNIVVDVALREVQRIVNESLRNMGGNPIEIIVELGREMSMGLTKRGEMIDGINKNKKRRDNAIRELETHDVIPTQINIDRYLLAEDQGFKCPYCQGGNHLTISDIADGSRTNFEHILPKSLTQVRRKKSELVLAHRACNDAKGDRTPYLAWGDGRDDGRWSAVEAMIDFLEAAKGATDPGTRKRLQRKARLLKLKDFEYEVLTDESIEDFADRQMHQTSWIAKLVAEWLKSICANVFVARGEMTAYLRSIWGLNTVIPELRYEAQLPVLDTDGKPISREEFDRYRSIWEGRPKETAERTSRSPDKRIDHRHHLIDACVIALSDRRLFQEMAKHYKVQSDKAKSGERVKLWLRPLPPNGLRNQVLEMARNAKLTHKPDHYPGGAYFEEFAYRKHQPTDSIATARLSRKAALSELAKATDTSAKARAKKTPEQAALDRINDIVSEKTKKIVLNDFNERLRNGMTPVEALAQPIIHPNFSAPIKRVNVYRKTGKGGTAFYDGESAQKILHEGRNSSDGNIVEHEKHYLSDGYECIVIKLENGRLITAESVPRFAARNLSRKLQLGEIRFYRGDQFAHPKTGEQIVIEAILKDAKVRFKVAVETRNWDKIEKNRRVKASLSAKELAKVAFR